MKALTRADLLLAAMQVACFLVLSAAGALELPRPAVYAAIAGLVLVLVGGPLVIGRLARTHPGSAWLAPVPDRSGTLIVEASLFVYLVFMILLALGLPFLGFKTSLPLGIIVGSLAVAGLVVGRALQVRYRTRSLWPYAATMSLVSPLQFIVLYLGR